MSRRIKYYRGKLGLSKSAPPGAILITMPNPTWYYCTVNGKLYCCDVVNDRKCWIRFPEYISIEELKATFPWEVFEEISRLEVLVHRDLAIFEHAEIVE